MSKINLSKLPPANEPQDVSEVGHTPKEYLFNEKGKK